MGSAATEAADSRCIGARWIGTGVEERRTGVTRIGVPVDEGWIDVAVDESWIGAPVAEPGVGMP